MKALPDSPEVIVLLDQLVMLVKDHSQGARIRKLVLREFASQPSKCPLPFAATSPSRFALGRLRVGRKMLSRIAGLAMLLQVV